MKKVFGYLFLSIYLLVSAVSFTMLLKPGASFFYIKEEITPTQVVRDSGYSFRYKPSGQGFLLSAPQKIFLLEDGKYLENSEINKVVVSGTGLFSIGETKSDRVYIFFSSSDNSDPVSNHKTYTLIYPNPVFSPWTLAGGLIIFLAGLFYIWKFIPEAQNAWHKREDVMKAFMDKIIHDIQFIYTRLMNAPRIYTGICFSIAAIQFTITALRVATTGITYDEAFTYIYYAGSLEGFTRIELANNHPLNSLLIYLSTHLSGIYFNEVIVRLPVLLFYLLYLIVAIRFSAQFKYKYLTFALLSTNYFLSEYFGLARGYSMAAALLLTGLYVYAQDHSNQDAIIRVIYLFLLACTANFSTLVFLACFVLYVIIFDVKIKNLLSFIKKKLDASCNPVNNDGTDGICLFAGYP